MTTPPGPRVWHALRALLRTRIAAGLLTVIPLWVTWVVVKFVFETMKGATEPLAKFVTGNFALLDTQNLPASMQEYEGTINRVIDWSVPVIAVLLTLSFLYVLGLMTVTVVGRRVISQIERFFENLPFVKTVYSSTKQVVTTLGGTDTSQFKRVVLVEFPRPGMKCIAFLTSVMQDIDTGRKMATVFISTTPNPTTGYMQILPLEEVSETHWTVEEAVKLLMSGGLLSPDRIAFDRVYPVAIQPPGVVTEGSSEQVSPPVEAPESEADNKES
jgi:uncharacterized membrane protein